MELSNPNLIEPAMIPKFGFSLSKKVTGTRGDSTDNYLGIHLICQLGLFLEVMPTPTILLLD